MATRMITVSIARRKYIMVHHTADPMKDWDIEKIREDHMARGYLDIGYNWGIDNHGQRHRLRDPKYAGAHCPRYNISAFGVVVAGNFEIEYPTEDQVSGLILLTKDIYKYHKPGLEILGHRDGKATLCPGEHLYAMLDEIREAVK